MRSLSRFWAPGGVVLVGDAAHTVTPALGQVRRQQEKTDKRGVMGSEWPRLLPCACLMLCGMEHPVLIRA